MPRRYPWSTASRVALAGAAVAGAGLAGVAAASPGARAELHRLRRFARPLGPVETRPPAPPRLPPGCLVPVPGRGEFFVRDSGGEAGKPAVLLLHGWTATADLNFFSVYDELASTYWVLALDHRGHGRGLRSDEPFRLEDCADDAAGVLRALGVPRVLVAGYSMGGPIAMLLWRRHREVVAGLVLEATAIEWRGSLRERAVWKTMSAFEAGLRFGTGEGFVQRILREAIEQQPELDRYRPWVAAEFERGYARDLAAAGRALAEFDARPFVADIDVPTAVVLTTADLLVRPIKQRQLAAALGAPVFELVADHDAPFARMEDFAKITRVALDHVATAAGLSR